MTSLLLSFLWALAIGACLGAAYDIIRIQRILLGVPYGNGSAAKLDEIKLPLISKYKLARPRDAAKPKKRASGIALNIVIFLGDILFCFFAALVMVVFIYHTNDGNARGIVFLGSALGFSAYYFSVGKLVMFFSRYIVFGLKSAVKYILFFTLVPVWGILSSAARFCRRLQVRRYTRKEIKRIIDASKNGFLG